MILVFDKHNIEVPLDIVREKVQVEVGLHPHVHTADHAVQSDVRVDWDHFWRESGKIICQILMDHVTMFMDYGSGPAHFKSGSVLIFNF